MKLQIDFDKKTIALEQNVELGEFVKKIKSFIPDWKEWTLETNNTIQWYDPYKPFVPYYDYTQPLWDTVTTATGTYQVELN